jgi:hypothetical protein
LDPSVAAVTSTFINYIAFASIALRSFASFVGRLVPYLTDLDHNSNLPLVRSIHGPGFLLALIEIHFPHLAVIAAIRNFTNYLPIAFPTPRLLDFHLLENPTVGELLVVALDSIILADPPAVVLLIFPLIHPIEYQLVVPARIVLPVVDLVRPYLFKLKFECFL